MVENVFKRDLCAFMEKWAVARRDVWKSGVGDVEFVEIWEWGRFGRGDMCSRGR